MIVEIVFSSGRKASMSARKFRKIMGINKLRSTIFKAKFGQKKILFFGQGWGHGVGLCQYGAYQMAKENKNMSEIIQYYFPATQRTKIY